MVDSGDLFFKKFLSPPPEKERESLIQRAYLILKSLNMMEYHALGIGDDDLTLGKDFLHELSKTSSIPFLSANLIDEETQKPLFNRYIIKEINRLKIGIFSLLSPETFSGPSDPRKKGIVFEDPLTTAREMIQELSPQVDLLILLSHLGYHKDIELAQKTDGIHLIFGSHTGVDLMNPPIIKNTVILQNASRGMYARKLNLTYLNKEVSFYNEAIKSVYQQNLQKYQRQLETKTASEAERNQWEKAVQNIKETLDQFSKRNAFRITSLALSGEFNEHPEISKMIEDYKSKFPEKVEPPSHDSRGTYRPRL